MLAGETDQEGTVGIGLHGQLSQDFSRVEMLHLGLVEEPKRTLARLMSGHTCHQGGHPLGAGDVLAGAGIDLDHVALVDKQRDLHHKAGLEGGRLAGP